MNGENPVELAAWIKKVVPELRGRFVVRVECLTDEGRAIAYRVPQLGRADVIRIDIRKED